MIRFERATCERPRDRKRRRVILRVEYPDPAWYSNDFSEPFKGDTIRHTWHLSQKEAFRLRAQLNRLLPVDEREVIAQFQAIMRKDIRD